MFDATSCLSQLSASFSAPSSKGREQNQAEKYHRRVIETVESKLTSTNMMKVLGKSV